MAKIKQPHIRMRLLLAERGGFSPVRPYPTKGRCLPFGPTDKLQAIFSLIKSPTPFFRNKKGHQKMVLFCWRREGDLNPRYAYGVYTISNRAHSATLTSLHKLLCYYNTNLIKYQTNLGKKYKRGEKISPQFSLEKFFNIKAVINFFILIFIEKISTTCSNGSRACGNGSAQGFRHR